MQYAQRPYIGQIHCFKGLIVIAMYKVSLKQSKHNYIWYLQLAIVGSYQQLHVSAIIRLFILKSMN